MQQAVTVTPIKQWDGVKAKQASNSGGGFCVAVTMQQFGPLPCKKWLWRNTCTSSGQI